MVAEARKPNRSLTIAGRRISTRQAEFARLVMLGKTYSEAYLVAYGPFERPPKPASLKVMAGRIARGRHVQEEIVRLRSVNDRRVLLTLDERRKILASIILDPHAKRMEVIAATVAYSRMSDNERIPVQTESNVTPAPALPAGPLVRRLSPRERLEEMRRARAERKAEEAQAAPAPPPPAIALEVMPEAPAA